MAVVPRWFKVVAVLALLWNLMGCWAFVADLRITPENLAKLTAAQQEMYASRPSWSVAATGIAVIGGALGCIGLLLGKRWSTSPLVLSLLGVIAQDLSFLLPEGSLAALPPTALALQAVVLVVSVLLAWLSHRAARRGWVS